MRSESAAEVTLTVQLPPGDFLLLVNGSIVLVLLLLFFVCFVFGFWNDFTTADIAWLCNRARGN